MSEVYAHSLPVEVINSWEPLRAHSEAVAARAAACAEPFGWAPVADVAGRLHDIGKCSAAFQDYLREPPTRTRGPDHSTAGAMEARRHFPGPLGRILAFVLAGHHAGLADGIDLEERLRKTLPPYDGWERQGGRIAIGTAMTPGRLRGSSPHRGFSLAFLTRLLFSCLVDADFVETEAFCARAESEGNGVTRRHEFVLYFDVINGNPNGDPDAGNLPRLDPETNQGLVSDVCLKRKIRNYVALARPDAKGHEIYMREGATLNNEHKRAWAAVLPEVTKAEDWKKLPKEDAKSRDLTRWMCANFWDIRAFGAVMTTGVNAGQVRGPVQIAFARSVEPILPLEISITRMAATTETDAEAKGGRTMGRKHIVPYGLYRAHGFVSAPLASHAVKGTGFSEADLALLFEALSQMFDHDRSAARGEMATRRLIVFRHATALGNAAAHELFKRVDTLRAHQGSQHPIGAQETDNWPPARRFEDYVVTLDGTPVEPLCTMVDVG